MTPDDLTEPAYDPRKLDEYIADLCLQCGQQAVLEAVMRHTSQVSHQGEPRWPPE